MKVKSSLAGIVVLAIALSLAACGGGGGSSSGETPTTPTTPQPPTTPTTPTTYTAASAAACWDNNHLTATSQVSQAAAQAAADALVPGSCPTQPVATLTCPTGMSLEQIGPVKGCVLPMGKYIGSAGVHNIVAVTPQFKTTVAQDPSCGIIGSPCWNTAVSKGEISHAQSGDKDYTGKPLLRAVTWTMRNYGNGEIPVWITNVPIVQASGLPPTPQHPEGHPGLAWNSTAESDRFVGTASGFEARQNGVCFETKVSQTNWVTTMTTVTCSNF